MPGLDTSLQVAGYHSADEYNDAKGGFWGGNPTGNNSPWTEMGDDNRDFEQKQRDLLAGEWSRYKDIYRPLEDYMFDNLNNWGEITRASQNTAMQSSQKQFTLGRQSNERALRGM